MSETPKSRKGPVSSMACCCTAQPPGAGFTICYAPPDDCLPKCVRITLNVILAPFYWVWRAIDIYLLGCLIFYGWRLFGGIIRLICCVPCGVRLYFFKDHKFPPSSKSLGNWHNKTQHQLDQEIVWKRAGELFADQPAQGDCTHRVPAALFYGKAEPADIEQGELGDCWLMTGLGCLASVSNGSIHNLFVTKEYAISGGYVVRLYDGLHKKWKRVKIDDYIPCHKDSGQPIFAKPNDRELWCLLFEKAVAKLMGGYDMLAGGNILVAFQLLTGDPVFHLSKTAEGVYQRFDLRYFEPRESDKDSFGRTKRSIGLMRTKETFTKDDLFHILAAMSKNRALIGAGTGGVDGGEETSKHGLIQGHAYSVLSVREVSNSSGFMSTSRDKFRMVQLRNPWGSFEWTGAWSDKDANWNKYKNVAKKLRRNAKNGAEDDDDGVFWMTYDDFWENFQQIDLCDRSTGFGDLAFSVDEQQGFCGPARGCAWGCFKYWCMCKMCRATVFGHVGGEPLIDGKTFFQETEV